MSAVLTLVGSEPEVIDQAVHNLARAMNLSRPVEWLADDHACDIALDAVSQGHLAAAKQSIQGIIDTVPVDWCLQPEAGRRKRMLIADMDSTIIGQECLDELAELRGIKPEIAALTERAMRGELDFEAALHARIDLLKGMTEADIQHVLNHRITLNPGAKVLVQTMKAFGAHTIMVSGGFTVFTAAIAAQVGFDDHRANRFLWTEGGISGVAEPIMGRAAKRTTLLSECERLGFQPGEVIAVGDGANDLDMFEAAGLGVAYYAKPVVAEQADARVIYGDLTTLLYFQGYRDEEFIR